MNNGNIYDKFVNKNVVLTLYNGYKQYLKIIKNDNVLEQLHIIDKNSNEKHILVYKNIGEDSAVVKIDLDPSYNK